MKGMYIYLRDEKYMYERNEMFIYIKGMKGISQVTKVRNFPRFTNRGDFL